MYHIFICPPKNVLNVLVLVVLIGGATSSNAAAVSAAAAASASVRSRTRWHLLLLLHYQPDLIAARKHNLSRDGSEKRKLKDKAIGVIKEIVLGEVVQADSAPVDSDETADLKVLINKQKDRLRQSKRHTTDGTDTDSANAIEQSALDASTAETTDISPGPASPNSAAIADDGAAHSEVTDSANACDSQANVSVHSSRASQHQSAQSRSSLGVVSPKSTAKVAPHFTE